ncbi:MAG: hypothetical protein P8X89_17275 [Reinekea sp.]
MFPKNWGEPTGAPAIFEKQIEIKLLHPASTLKSRIQAEISKWMMASVQLPGVQYWRRYHQECLLCSVYQSQT